MLFLNKKLEKYLEKAILSMEISKIWKFMDHIFKIGNINPKKKSHLFQKMSQICFAIFE